MKSDLALTKEMLFDNTGYLHYDRNDVNVLITESNLDGKARCERLKLIERIE